MKKSFRMDCSVGNVKMRCDEMNSTTQRKNLVEKDFVFIIKS